MIKLSVFKVLSVQYFGEDYILGEELTDYVDGGKLSDILEDKMEPAWKNDLQKRNKNRKIENLNYR